MKLIKAAMITIRSIGALLFGTYKEWRIRRRWLPVVKAMKLGQDRAIIPSVCKVCEANPDNDVKKG